MIVIGLLMCCVIGLCGWCLFVKCLAIGGVVRNGMTAKLIVVAALSTVVSVNLNPNDIVNLNDNVNANVNTNV